MKKSKKYIAAAVIILISFIWIVYSYPQRGSFYNLVIRTNKMRYEYPAKIILTRDSTVNSDYKEIKDKEKIHTIVSKLSELEMIEYKKDIPDGWKNIYGINIDQNIMITIFDSGYMTVRTGDDYSFKLKCYKITSDLDLEYMKGLLS